MRAIKHEIRIIGWDDSPFTFDDEYTYLIGVVCRGGLQVDGLLSTKIKVDGLDVTKRIVDAINGSTHKDQLRLIMLEGITFGGFNIADIKEINEKTGIPVLVIIRDKPNMEAIRASLKRFDDFKKRWELIKNAGEIYEVYVDNKTLNKKRKIYYQVSGMNTSDAERIIKLTSIHSIIPEPIRLAHIIASGLKGLRK